MSHLLPLGDEGRQRLCRLLLKLLVDENLVAEPFGDLDHESVLGGIGIPKPCEVQKKIRRMGVRSF